MIKNTVILKEILFCLMVTNIYAADRNHFLSPIDIVTDNTNIYVAQNNADRMDIIDIKSTDIKGQIKLPHQLNSLAISGDKRLYASLKCLLPFSIQACRISFLHDSVYFEISVYVQG